MLLNSGVGNNKKILSEESVAEVMKIQTSVVVVTRDAREFTDILTAGRNWHSLFLAR